MSLAAGFGSSLPIFRKDMLLPIILISMLLSPAHMDMALANAVGQAATSSTEAQQSSKSAPPNLVEFAEHLSSSTESLVNKEVLHAELMKRVNFAVKQLGAALSLLLSLEREAIALSDSEFAESMRNQIVDNVGILVDRLNTSSSAYDDNNGHDDEPKTRTRRYNIN